MTGPRVRPPSGGNGGIGEKSPLRFMNRRITIMRGQEIGPYGEKTNVGTPYLTDVPAAIAEVSRTAFDPATQRPQIIRSIQGIVPGWAGVQTTDTLVDPVTGFAYMIEDMYSEPGIGIYPPRTILTLRLRSGVTVQGET